MIPSPGDQGVGRVLAARVFKGSNLSFLLTATKELSVLDNQENSGCQADARKNSDFSSLPKSL
jgi:hypothetical protein